MKGSSPGSSPNQPLKGLLLFVSGSVTTGWFMLVPCWFLKHRAIERRNIRTSATVGWESRGSQGGKGFGDNVAWRHTKGYIYNIIHTYLNISFQYIYIFVHLQTLRKTIRTSDFRKFLVWWHIILIIIWLDCKVYIGYCMSYLGIIMGPYEWPRSIIGTS